jgi:hypothetical protein
MEISRWRKPPVRQSKQTKPGRGRQIRKRSGCEATTKIRSIAVSCGETQ